jgi:MSHA biogenesis protein MshO
MRIPRRETVKNQRGFTLMEMVITIVLLGIVGVMSVELIMPIIGGYTNARATDRLYNEAKFAVERIDRELRMAIPNTLRETDGGTGVQFGLLADAGYYSDSHADNDKIEVDSTMYGNLNINDNLSIYNTDSVNFYNGNRVYQLTNKLAANIIQLDSNLTPHSPSRRLYLLDAPVTFYHSGTQLLRSFDYGLGSNNFGTSGGDVLATRVESATFTYNPGSLSRNATLQIDLTMAEKDLHLDYSHQIHIRNVP